MARIRVIAAVAGILGVTFACGQIVSPPGLAAPINSCPVHPCSAYVEPGAAPSCSAGVCTSVTPMNDLVLVISLPTDAFVAPGRTYVMALSSEPTASGSCSPEDPGVETDGGIRCDPPRCSPPCCALPGYTQDTTNYVVDLDEATKVDRYLGNNGNTSLPIEATYRLIWGPDGGDALSLGLPVEPVQGQLLKNAGGAYPGPGNTQSLLSQAYLSPGCYERTLQPYEPFASAYPPSIHVIPLWESSPLPASDVIIPFDPTSEQTGKKPFPTFQITRANGLDGWTAYLRDQTTKRRFSNVAALSGSFAEVKLATYHRSSTVPDALTNLELAVAPPSGTPLPTYVSAPVLEFLAEGQLYPALPTPVTMTGRILTLDGLPVDADVVFTATDITNPSGGSFPSTSFEFVARTSAIRDPKTGMSAYSILLPRGHYQVAVLPRDTSSALTVVSRRVEGVGNTIADEDIVVGTLSSVRGSAVVADGRSLAEAVVEVVPTRCSIDSPPGVAPDPSAPCMPRPAETTAAGDGSFALALDPGGYLLRVRPADGSNFPWVMRPIAVGLGSLRLPPFTVPAPVHLSMTLVDGTMTCTGNVGPCVGNAIVRVFTNPSSGSQAIELGQAITDTTGHFDMYLAPPAGTP